MLSTTSAPPYVDSDSQSPFSPQRKKARRISDARDAVQQRLFDQRCSASAMDERVALNPLNLLCFAMETEFENKENIAREEIEAEWVMKPRRVSLPSPAPFASTTNRVTEDFTDSPQVAPVAPTDVAPANPSLSLPQKASSSGKRSYQPWAVRFQELLEFKRLCGNCRVPQKSPHYPSLARWVVYMRAQYKAGKLTPDKIAQLEEVGFEWSADRSGVSEWNERYHELQRFLRAHGHLNVLRNQNPALHYWCYMQRRKRAGLSTEYLIKLDQLGFDWSLYFDANLQPIPSGARFDNDALLNELQVFYRIHGHAQVPLRFPASPALAQWARQVKIRDLDKKQLDLMNALGFVWKNETVHPANQEMGTMTNYGFLRTMSVSLVK